MTIIIVINDYDDNNIPLTEFWGNFMMTMRDKLISRNRGQPMTSLLDIRIAVDSRNQIQGSGRTADCHNPSVQQLTCLFFYIHVTVHRDM
jgi:hypothetical protein